MSAWGRVQWRAVGAFWAVLAFFCFSLPHCLVLAHFSAAPGFLSHLVNLQSLKQKEGGRREGEAEGGRREGWGVSGGEEMRQMWISD